MVSDGAAAEKFYGALLGWTFRHTDMGDKGIYRLIDANGREQGGIVEVKPETGIHAHWCGYISVPDVDAAAKIAAEQGGKVACAPMNIPDVGRFAYIVDPEGAGFVVFRDNRGDSPAKERPGVGDFCWDSLGSRNGERALEFYGAVAGWKRGKFGDAPGLFFAANDGNVIADVETPPEGAPSHWMCHVVVVNLKESLAKAESLGAKILMPDIVVPTVGKMGVIMDPWGAVISLFEPQMAG